MAGFVLYLITRTIPVVVPAAIVAAVMIAECVLASAWLGRVLDRSDVTALEAIE